MTAPLMRRDDDQVMVCPVERSGFAFFYSRSQFCRPSSPRPFEDPALVQFEITAGNIVTSTPVSDLYRNDGVVCRGDGTVFTPTHTWSYGNGNRPFQVAPITAGDTLRVRAVGGEGRRIDLITYSTCSKQYFFTPNTYVDLSTERLDVTSIHTLRVYSAISWYQNGYPSEWNSDVYQGDTVGVAVQARDVDDHWTWSESFISLLPDVPLVAELDDAGARYGRLVLGAATGRSVSGVYTEGIERARTLQYVIDGEEPPAFGDSVIVTVYRADQPGVRGQVRLTLQQATPPPPPTPPSLARFEVAVTPATVRHGERALVSAIARDTREAEVALEPTTPVNVWAYEGVGASYGIVTNTRTGAQAARVLSVPYSDVRAGRVSILPMRGAAARGVPQPRTDVGLRLRRRAPEVADTSSGPVYRGRSPAGPSGSGLTVEPPHPVSQPIDAATAGSGAGGDDSSASALEDEADDEIIFVDVEIGGYATYGFFDLTVTPDEASLTLTADPDTLSAGGEAHFTIAAPGLDPAMPVTFSVPDLRLGGFAADTPVARGTAGRGAPVERVLSVTRPLSEISEVRFIAVDDVDSTATVTISATAGGRSGTVDVTVMPLHLGLLRQNGAEVTAGYVMVSKARPDWYLPTEVLPFQTRTDFEGAFPDDDRSLYGPSPEDYDPHTYRLQAGGIQQLVEPANLIFRLSISRAGQPVPIWAEGITGVDSVTGEDGGDFVSFPAVCQNIVELDIQTCRSNRFIRLVSNSRPYELRGITRNCASPTDPAGCYDDEAAGTQTIRVELGDYVRWDLYSLNERLGSDSLRVGAPDIEPVGVPDEEGNGYDIARTVHVRFIGTQGLEEPMDANATARRMSEYWAQASINFQSEGDGLTVPDLGSTDPSSTARTNTYEIDTRADDEVGREPTVPADGLLWATVGGGSRVSIPVSRGERVHDAVVRLVFGLDGPGVVQVVRHRMRDDGRAGSPYDYSTLVHVRSGFSQGLSIGSNVPELRIRLRRVIGGDMATEVPLVESSYKRLALELHVLALTYGSEDAHTVDAYVVPDSALARVRVGPAGTGMSGQAFTADFLGGEAAALVNSFVMVSNAADGHDAAQGSQAYGFPVTASHEVGHVLFNSEYPGPDSTLTHSLATNNVMYFQGGDISDPQDNPVISEPALMSRRRLSVFQQIDVRLSRPSFLSPFVPVTPSTPVAPRAAAAEPTAIRTVSARQPAPVIVTREHE